MVLWSDVLRRQARLLVEYCIAARSGDEVYVTGTVEALPLVYEVVRELVSRGAYPYTVLRDELLSEAFYRYASREALAHEPRVDLAIVETVDAMISIRSSTHTRYLSGIDPERVRLASAASRKVREKFLERSARGELRWVVTAYPTKALAQEAGMSFGDYADFVFRAMKLYERDPVEAWREQARRQEKVVKLLEGVDELRIVGENVDLTLKAAGRKWINDDGRHNMPGGEVFTAPHEDSVEGWIVFEYPSVYHGYEVEGVKLVFKRGVVIEATAVRGGDVLRRVLETDEGARRVGEFAFGLNYSITRPVRDILFDEKIGGTIHLALGAAYPETGGKNQSAIHWDLIKDARRVKVYADGDLVYENGRFTVWGEEA